MSRGIYSLIDRADNRMVLFFDLRQALRASAALQSPLFTLEGALEMRRK